ncbi:anaphase-promoting complex subunit 11 [Gossypium hirsutum]|uniref:Anaphase-promoting complex subunit 11 n=5 Tax=Gossypium TaxID=3633 RepID=A0ABM2ZGD5_GOSHI|nr:anaphase-promoting complex subunit 11-like [Gossypium hirsutum]
MIIFRYLRPRSAAIDVKFIHTASEFSHIGLGFAGEDESQVATWHAVASWTWDAQDETCGICRMAFDGCCSDCKLPGDDCPLIWGACNHAFHLHCILKWVNSQTSQAHCPMCRREWKFKG